MLKANWYQYNPAETHGCASLQYNGPAENRQTRYTEISSRDARAVRLCRITHHRRKSEKGIDR
ncbi:MAG: hypothetical protein BWK80_09780 [Desulfobacteraceae bacterium IS3]|nr:MAG: hypothetical protein BWK80_09780 [Desulfobacteraceae bacterium IS3]